MRLQQWVDEHGTSLSKVARRADVAYTTILRARDGELVRFDVAERISAATDGEVRVEDLCRSAATGGEAA